MTVEQAKTLNLGIKPINEAACLMIESAFSWVLENTTLKFDIENIEELKALPAQVRLFVYKYNEAMSIGAGVSSESTEGLSQSFTSGNKAGLIWEIAESLLGKWLISPVTFVPAVSRWEDGR